uniref:Uncharacterized protein n=1 Tax=Physcomitrium patens TaxID=3218 RepID=A0A2K1IQT9_PHYPA|nr:hypothetical protein PHYPA_025767 [Physcomitrium patens]
MVLLARSFDKLDVNVGSIHVARPEKVGGVLLADLERIFAGGQQAGSVQMDRLLVIGCRSTKSFF